MSGQLKPDIGQKNHQNSVVEFTKFERNASQGFAYIWIQPRHIMLGSAFIRTFANRFPLTVNLHFLRACNFRCKYCYATFDDCQDIVSGLLPFEKLSKMVDEVSHRFCKVTFAGGEPTLYTRLPQLMQVARAGGALVNVVTNASQIDPKWVAEHGAKMDLLTISADSENPATHVKLGRASATGKPLPTSHYIDVAKAAQAIGVKVKLNTVVTTVNQQEDLTQFVKTINPIRWKILQAMPIEGQNDTHITSLIPSEAAFRGFAARHERSLAGTGIRIIPEWIEDIRTSYIMVDPLGRFFDDATGVYRYSRSILDVGVDAAWGDVVFNIEKFTARNGAADFAGRICQPEGK
jgi:radical S-adenosyl methionine domain-containing protein 2